MNLGSGAVSVLLLVWFYFLDESPRWLLATGQVEKAKVTLKKVLAINGMTNETLDADIDNLSSYLIKVSHSFVNLRASSRENKAL